MIYLHKTAPRGTINFIICCKTNSSLNKLHRLIEFENFLCSRFFSIRLIQCLYSKPKSSLFWGYTRIYLNKTAKYIISIDKYYNKYLEKEKRTFTIMLDYVVGWQSSFSRFVAIFGKKYGSFSLKIFERIFFVKIRVRLFYD